MEYNTERDPLILKEYGRNVQKLVNFIKAESDKDKRSEYAQTLVELMRQITPSNKELQENLQKMWDDLFIISDFDLDINGPFPPPERELINKRPPIMEHQKNKIKYLHYGRNIELLILEAMKKEDPEERDNAVIYVGKLMKSFYGSWNKEIIDDAVIVENIRTISGGELNIDLDRVREENLFEKLYKTTAKRKPQRAPQRTPQRKGGSNNAGRRRKSN
ncbi:MAG: DUF4290 domain-containing protein [Cyclobacteriaceae bacterium]|nr:DUF4290 domain-containing protein [Cyclobacteriaceae bacterium]